MTKDEALKMALEALEGADMIDCDMREAITAIKEALAQPEPEYVAFMDVPQRTWVGLTDEEISELIRATHNTGSFVRAIEAKLKAKNT